MNKMPWRLVDDAVYRSNQGAPGLVLETDNDAGGRKKFSIRLRQTSEKETSSYNCLTVSINHK